MYTINISYQTGDSFRTENTEDTVGHVWDNLDRAKEALQYIKEHYKAQEDIPYNDEDFIKKYKSNPWCKEKYPFFSLLVPNDAGELVSISVFWCGYFETLYGAEIVTEGDTEMSFEL